MTFEQKRIEKELADFEKSIFGDPAKKDSLDSIAAANNDTKVKKKSKSRRNKGNDEEVSSKPRRERSSSSGRSGSRVSVRRERH